MIDNTVTQTWVNVWLVKVDFIRSMLSFTHVKPWVLLTMWAVMATTYMSHKRERFLAWVPCQDTYAWECEGDLWVPLCCNVGQIQHLS